MDCLTETTVRVMSSCRQKDHVERNRVKVEALRRGEKVPLPVCRQRQDSSCDPSEILEVSKGRSPGPHVEAHRKHVVDGTFPPAMES